MRISTTALYAAAAAVAGTLGACSNSASPSTFAPQGSLEYSLKQSDAPPFDAAKISPDRIVYTPTNVQIENYNYNLDLNNDSTTDFVIAEANTVGYCYYHQFKIHTNYYSTLSLTGQSSNGVEVSGGDAAQLVSGSPIGPSQIFSTGSWYLEKADDFWFPCLGGRHYKGFTGNWPPNSSGYLGMAFAIRGKTHYGWAAISVGSPQSGWLSATLTGYAYQTRAGKSITAGQM